MDGFSSESMDFDQMGLKVLTIHRHEWDQYHRQRKSCVMTSSMLSPTSSCSSDVMGDYIGTESCFDVFSDETDIVSDEPNRFNSRMIRPRGSRRETPAAREFPPPIRMPWVLKRVYTSDGRLILREEKVRHHEYFRAYRSNGRLTLQLVPLDDDDVLHQPLGAHFDEDDDHHHHHNDPEIDDHYDRLDGHIVSNDTDKVNIDDDGDDGIRHDTCHDDLGDVDGGEGDGYCEINVENDGGGTDGGDEQRRLSISLSKFDPTVADSGIGNGGSPVGKCLKSCFLGMQVPKIRPVLS